MQELQSKILDDDNEDDKAHEELCDSPGHRLKESSADVRV